MAEEENEGRGGDEGYEHPWAQLFPDIFSREAIAVQAAERRAEAEKEAALGGMLMLAAASETVRRRSRTI